MARPIPTRKESVKLASPGVRVSRIRRDPPPVEKQKLVLDSEERDQWTVLVGVVTFALSLFVIMLAFSSYSGWSLSNYTIHIDADQM